MALSIGPLGRLCLNLPPNHARTDPSKRRGLAVDRIYPGVIVLLVVKAALPL